MQKWQSSPLSRSRNVIILPPHYPRRAHHAQCLSDDHLESRRNVSCHTTVFSKGRLKRLTVEEPRFLDTTLPAAHSGRLRRKRRCLEWLTAPILLSSHRAVLCRCYPHPNPRVQCFLDIKGREVTQSFPFLDLLVNQFPGPGRRRR